MGTPITRVGVCHSSICARTNYLREPSLFLSDQVALDLWLSASFDTGDVISSWINTVLMRISLFQSSQFGFAEVKSSFPVNTFWLASLHHQRFWVLSLAEHTDDGVYVKLRLPCEIIDITLYYLLRSV